MVRSLFLLAPLAVIGVLATPSVPNDLESRAATENVENIVYVTDQNKHCLMMPREPHTNIAATGSAGSTKTYCTPAGRFSPNQGQLPPDFWKNVEFKSGKGKNGKRFATLTGCINASKLSRLNPSDVGGKYYSDNNRKGSPDGSNCLGYQYYMQAVEPRYSRACIKCYDDPADGPANLGASGCPSLISGNYFDCA